MLVGPDRPHAGCFDDLENRVGSNILVRVHRNALTVYDMPLHVVWIELREDFAKHTAARDIGDELGRVVVAFVQLLEIGHLGASVPGTPGILQALAGVECLRWIFLAVVAVVIEQPGGFRGAAGDLGKHARIAV